jgi:hypothetical protein
MACSGRRWRAAADAERSAADRESHAGTILWRGTKKNNRCQFIVSGTFKGNDEPTRVALVS